MYLASVHTAPLTEKEKISAIAAETSREIPPFAPWVEQLQIHGEKIRQAGLRVPNDQILRNLIEDVRRKGRLSELAKQSPEVQLQREIKRKQISIMRHFAQEIREKPLEERREILAKELEKAGVEKPKSFERSLRRMSDQKTLSRVLETKRKAEQEASVYRSMTYKKAIGEGHGNQRLVRRGLRDNEMDINLNLIPQENDDGSSSMTDIHASSSKGPQQQAQSAHLQREEGYKGKEKLVEQHPTEGSVASPDTPRATVSQDHLPMLSEEEASKLTKKQRLKMYHQGRLPHDARVAFEYRSKIIQDGHKRRAAYQHLSTQDYRTLVRKWRAQTRLKAQNGTLSPEERARFKDNQKYIARKQTRRLDLSGKKYTGQKVMRSISHQLLAAESEKHALAIIHDAHSASGLTPPTEKQAKRKLYTLKWRAVNRPMEPMKSKVKEASTSETHSPQASRPHLQRRSPASAQADQGALLLRRMFDLNASPRAGSGSHNSHSSIIGETEVNSKAASYYPGTDLDVAKPGSSHQSVPRLFGVALSSGRELLSSHDVAAEFTPSTSAALPSKGKKRRYEGLDVSEVRTIWKDQKVREKIAHQGELSDEDQHLFDIRSKIKKDALIVRAEFERLNPDKKGNYIAWRNFKEAAKRERRRKFLAGELNEEERLAYEKRREIYAHLIPAPKANVPRIITSHKLMRSISGDLSLIPDMELRKTFIAQAFKRANLEVPSGNKLRQKAKNSYWYQTRKRVQEAQSSAADASKSVSAEALNIPASSLPRIDDSGPSQQDSLQHNANRDSSSSTQLLGHHSDAITGGDAQRLAKQEERRKKYMKSLLAKKNKLDPATKSLYDARSAAIKEGQAAKRKRLEEAESQGGHAAAASVEVEWKKKKTNEKKRRNRHFRSGKLSAEESEKFKAQQELFFRSGTKSQWGENSARSDVNTREEHK